MREKEKQTNETSFHCFDSVHKRKVEKRKGISLKINIDTCAYLTYFIHKKDAKTMTDLFISYLHLKILVEYLY